MDKSKKRKTRTSKTVTRQLTALLGPSGEQDIPASKGTTEEAPNVFKVRMLKPLGL